MLMNKTEMRMLRWIQGVSLREHKRNEEIREAATVVRPAMLYGAETWATTKRQESRIAVNEMRMLRWMCGVTRKDKIRNEHIRGTTKVAQAPRKITERTLKWYGHVMRMEEDHVVKRVMTKAIPGKRKRGRPKTRWKDVCKRDMQTVGLREGDAWDRAYWKEMMNNHSGDPRWREKPEEKKKKKGSSNSSADSNTPDAEATTLVWTCQTERWMPYHQNSAGHGGRRCETARKTEIKIHGHHQEGHQKECADGRRHSRPQ